MDVKRILFGLILAGPAIAQTQVAKLTASDAAQADEFGNAVAIDGDVVIIGALENDKDGPDAGAAYIALRNQGGANAWDEVIKLTAENDPPTGIFFGWSVAVDGDIAVVGAPAIEGPLWDGSAYIFARNQDGPNNWGLIKRLVNPGMSNNKFGISVTVSGDNIVVGAEDEELATVRVGAAYVFSRNQGGVNNWGLVSTIMAPTPTFTAEFGRSVALDGPILVVGAHSEDHVAPGDSDCNSGRAYVFARDAGGLDNWGDMATLASPTASCGDAFGSDVDVQGDVVVVGTPQFSVDSGEAHVYLRNEGGIDTWGHAATLPHTGGQLNDNFGATVSATGDLVMVGAFRDPDEGVQAGSAFLFARDGTGANTWSRIARVVPDDVMAELSFGFAVAMRGDVAVIGAKGDDHVCPALPDCNAGSAYIFDIRCPPNCPGDVNGDNNVDLTDLNLVLFNFGLSCP